MSESAFEGSISSKRCLAQSQYVRYTVNGDPLMAGLFPNRVCSSDVQRSYFCAVQMYRLVAFSAKTLFLAIHVHVYAWCLQCCVV